MSEVNHARTQTLQKLYEKCRFTFQENELSPTMRQRIGLYSQILQEIWGDTNVVSNKERQKNGKMTTVIVFVVFGVLTLIFVIGVFFLIGAILYYIYSYKPLQNEYLEKKKALDNRTRIWYSNIEQFSKEITAELTAIHQQKISPKITEIKVDYATILKLAQEKDQLKNLKCPNCDAPIVLPTTGTTVICKYCNKTIQKQNILDELKQLLYPDSNKL